MCIAHCKTQNCAPKKSRFMEHEFISQLISKYFGTIYHPLFSPALTAAVSVLYYNELCYTVGSYHSYYRPPLIRALSKQFSAFSSLLHYHIPRINSMVKTNLHRRNRASLILSVGTITTKQVFCKVSLQMFSLMSHSSPVEEGSSVTITLSGYGAVL